MSAPQRHQAICTFFALTMPRVPGAGRLTMDGLLRSQGCGVLPFAASTDVAVATTCRQTNVQDTFDAGTAPFLMKALTVRSISATSTLGMIRGGS